MSRLSAKKDEERDSLDALSRKLAVDRGKEIKP